MLLYDYSHSISSRTVGVEQVNEVTISSQYRLEEEDIRLPSLSSEVALVMM